MILVFGGTTEGRRVVETLEKACEPFYYSTRSNLQHIETRNAIRLTGGLDIEQMKEFCLEKGIRVMVDAAHPFASLLHATIAEVSRDLDIPVVRFERRYPAHDERLIWCDDYQDAWEKLRESKVGRLLALTGVQTISKLKGYWSSHDCYFRILKREESAEIAEKEGFPHDRLVYYENDGDIESLIEKLQPDAIITKESGKSGGFQLKVDEALERGLKVFVVSRPKMPEDFITVTGEFGLRKTIEKLLPGFFKLRSGFTTGACATAAAKAALLALVEDVESQVVEFEIPDGEKMRIRVESVKMVSKDCAQAIVIKDAGDDPDVTDGSRIKANVKLADHGDVHFFGGEGIGRVTLPGLGLEIGEPAINPVPRRMMRNELLKINPKGCDVTISVPGGEELAKKTFNSRIGIEGGVSIIGTSGIVMPFSNEAFIEAIRREMEVAKAMYCERVVLNSGARSEKTVKTQYSELPAPAFIHYGNAIGESLKIASEIGFESVTVGLMLGKAVKLAEGNTDTHSHKVTMNREFLADVAQKSGCSDMAIDSIMQANMARELWTLLSEKDANKFFPSILHLCQTVCRQCYPHGELTLLLIDDNNIIRYKRFVSL